MLEGYYVTSDDAICSDCFTDDDWQGFEGWEEPLSILSSESVDSPIHCVKCESLLEVPLTEEGYRYVMDALLEAFKEERSLRGRTEMVPSRVGRLCILKQWYDFYLEDHLRELVNDWPDSDRYSPQNREEQA